MKFNVKHFLGITFLFVVGFLPTQVFAEDSVPEPNQTITIEYGIWGC